MSDTNSIDIGFLQKQDSWKLHPRFFPSKVGGKPAWLDLKHLPNPTELVCKKCNDPLIFLCQIYAPFEEHDQCFHRTVFIFICRNGKCCLTNSSENFLVLRCQLPRKNDFYSFEPYEEKEEPFAMVNWPKLCVVCGVRAPSHCSKCKKLPYCCRKHQVLDWQNGHKEACLNIQSLPSLNLSDFVVTKTGKYLLFDEWEIVIDSEEKEESTDTDVNKEMAKMMKLLQEKKVGSLNNVSEKELEEYVRTVPEDKTFNKFNKRIASNPEQVLRYDRGGTPLWMTGNLSETKNVDIPKCEYCGGDRQFEFQVMPQMLNFMNVGTDVNSIDWGILAVYTCKTSCGGDPIYKKEFMIKQDLCN